MRATIHQADDGADPLALENAIFEAALQLTDPARRREFLDRIFHGNPKGRKGMEELLEMEETASMYFLEVGISTAQLAREVLDELQGTGG